MIDRQDDERPEVNTRKISDKQFLVWYEGTVLAHIARAFAPLGGIVSAVGVVIAILTLGATLHEISEVRKVREATLFALAMERLEIARKMDSGKSATERVKEKRKCTKNQYQLSARHGQIPVLERMAKLQISLRHISAKDVNLVIYRGRRDVKKSEHYGIDLGGADLEKADLSGTNLSGAVLSNTKLTKADLDKVCMENANLTDADLRGASLERAVLIEAMLEDADLTNADLYKANLRKANMARTDLTNTNLTDADLKGVNNLTQTQLDSACADSDGPPMHLPKGEDGKRLIWKAKECFVKER